MKKELLRINRLNYNYTRTRKLENVSFCILEGECIGFLGLSYSGKDLMTSLLRGELTEGDGSGAIYLGGQKVNDWEVLGKEIYYMCPDNYVIEDWTVAEYLCLVDSGWAGSFWRKGVLNEEAGECFAELELDFDISSRMRDLSELEKRIVDVVKAYRILVKKHIQILRWQKNLSKGQMWMHLQLDLEQRMEFIRKNPYWI